MMLKIQIAIPTPPNTIPTMDIHLSFALTLPDEILLNEIIPQTIAAIEANEQHKTPTIPQTKLAIPHPSVFSPAVTGYATPGCTAGAGCTGAGCAC